MKQEYIHPELNIVLLKYTTPLLSDSLTELMSTGLDDEDAVILGGGIGGSSSEDEVTAR